MKIFSSGAVTLTLLGSAHGWAAFALSSHCSGMFYFFLHFFLLLRIFKYNFFSFYIVIPIPTPSPPFPALLRKGKASHGESTKPDTSRQGPPPPSVTLSVGGKNTKKEWVQAELYMVPTALTHMRKLSLRDHWFHDRTVYQITIWVQVAIFLQQVHGQICFSEPQISSPLQNEII